MTLQLTSNLDLEQKDKKDEASLKDDNSWAGYVPILICSNGNINFEEWQSTASN